MAKYLTQITEDVKSAMKAKAKDRLSVLRMLVADIKNEQHKEGIDDLSEEQEMQVLMRAVKTRKDSVQQALDAGRPEIAEKESAEIVIVETYLPQQMSGEELAAKVADVAAEVGYSGPKDTGKFMQAWMKLYKGQADGRAVQDALKAL